MPRLFQFFTFVAAMLVGFTLALLMSGCGAAPDSTALYSASDRDLGSEIDRPFEISEGFERADAELPPTWQGSSEMFDAPAAGRYHGGYAVAGYGVSHGGARYLQDGGETTWAVRAGSEPTRFQLSAARAAFERLGHLLPAWTFVELAAPNGQTDIVIDFRDNVEVPEGCSGPGTCWYGSASCKTLADVDTGVADLKVCERFLIDVAVNSIEASIASRHAEPALTWEAFFVHEIGHTLGLVHASKTSQSIMRPMLWLPAEGRTDIHGFSECELARLRGYLPMPGALAPIEVVNVAECGS